VQTFATERSLPTLATPSQNGNKAPGTVLNNARPLR
jgi:hypothetical protein